MFKLTELGLLPVAKRIQVERSEKISVINLSFPGCMFDRRLSFDTHERENLTLSRHILSQILSLKASECVSFPLGLLELYWNLTTLSVHSSAFTAEGVKRPYLFQGLQC